MKVLQLRDELNKIDQELGKLLIRRFEICREIGNHKKCNGIPVEDLERERQVVSNYIAKFNLPSDFVEEIYAVIFKHSRRIQER